jgi:ribulose-phosphate 3-epimerase
MHDLMPAIFEKDWTEIEKKLQRVKPFANTIHIDLLDGKFAQNMSFFDPSPFAAYKDDFFFELHMMVDEPEQYLESWAKAGIKRFMGHVEQMSDQVSFVAKAQELGEVGFALDADTEVEKIQVPLNDLDSILIMTVKAGFSGQAFMPENLSKVKAIRSQTTLPIEVDGGVTYETLLLAVRAGATRAGVTSYLFGSEEIEKRYHHLQEILTTEQVV